MGCAPYLKNDSEDDHKQNGRQFLIPSPLVPVLLEEILLHCAHAAGRQALAKIRATAWARQGVRFDRLFTGGALDPGGGKVDPPRSVKRDGADDDHDEDKPVHSLPLIAVRNRGNDAARSGPVPARKPNHPHVRITIMGLLYWVVANCGRSPFHSHQVLPGREMTRLTMGWWKP